MTDQETDYAKAEAFRQYFKACRHAKFHREVRSPKLTEEVSRRAVAIHERIALSLAAEYPDFPDALRVFFPDKPDIIIEPAA